MPKTTNIEIEGIGQSASPASRPRPPCDHFRQPGQRRRVSLPMRVSVSKAVDFVHLNKLDPQTPGHHRAGGNRKQALGIHLQTINKAEATQKIKDRLGFLAHEHGFNCNHVTVRQQKTRWGSLLSPQQHQPQYQAGTVAGGTDGLCDPA